MRSTSLLCVLLTIAICVLPDFAQAPPAKPLSAFDQELVANENQFLQALRDKNVTFVNGAVSENFRGIASNGDYYEKDELTSTAQEGLPKDFRAYDLQVVRLDDSNAVVSYNDVVPGSHPRYRHMSDTWTKHNGQWILKFQQTTPNLWSALDLD